MESRNAIKPQQLLAALVNLSTYFNHSSQPVGTILNVSDMGKGQYQVAIQNGRLEESYSISRQGDMIRTSSGMDRAALYNPPSAAIVRADLIRASWDAKIPTA